MQIKQLDYRNVPVYLQKSETWQSDCDFILETLSKIWMWECNKCYNYKPETIIENEIVLGKEDRVCYVFVIMSLCCHYVYVIDSRVVEIEYCELYRLQRTKSGEYEIAKG